MQTKLSSINSSFEPLLCNKRWQCYLFNVKIFFVVLVYAYSDINLQLSSQFRSCAKTILVQYQEARRNKSCYEQ